MDGEKLRAQIGANIAAYRKQSNMTQLELAEKLNYSDKAISKWERGEAMPDVITLVQLAQQFGVTVNDLLGTERPATTNKEPCKRKVNRRVVQMLVSLLVWLVALTVYVVLSSMNIPKSWIGFFYAVPVNAIVLLSLRSAWRDFSGNHLLVSLIVWGFVASFYATMLVFTSFNLWKLFLLGALGQVATSLWFRLFSGTKGEEEHG